MEITMSVITMLLIIFLGAALLLVVRMAQPRRRIGTLRTLSTPVRKRGELARPVEASVMISGADHQELSAAIAAARKLTARAGKMRSLQDKLARARVISAGRVPRDLITMNSHAEIIELASGERLNLTLVYPVEADMEEGRVSVFSSLGAALLGRCVGDTCEWPVPYGVRRFMINAVLFQPEAALARAA
jgi:regulator of nucleoside diphosphate kinase